MKIQALHLENFRGFTTLDLRLHPALTLLIGENGAGKTALLEALAVALGGLALPHMTWRALQQEDVRQERYEHAGLLDVQMQWPVRVAASGLLDARPIQWTRSMKPSHGRTLRTVKGTKRRVVEDLAKAVSSGEHRALPVVAYYGTQRLWRQKKVTQAKRGVGSRFEGYTHALDPASNHRLLTEWMYQQTLVELQSGKPVLQLRAVERAVCQCIAGTTRFFFDVKSQELQLERADGELQPFSFLSDGYRNMVAVVADIAWRSAVLNPHHGADAAALSEGVVLIDEVDLHLHPRWQRRVLGDLRRTFPRLQLVATTHSPQVIASAHRDEVRVLDRNVLVPLQPFVEGRDTNSLLEDVFGVPDRPAEAQREIDLLSRLLDDEEYEQAAAVLEALEARLGPDDPAVIRARWTLDREAATGETS
ncbi:AAA family ATPase [Polyangium aurulentum]|uniref:AAA family ATPase n=1 Tax=Polyangium aurulentum TaxID=2567896 RepID=UPI0010AE4BAA|nr:AAA family ATPase [Polyangium aurulentum]UQA54922.1 AAA family ATPase [Polyangium aurulentum]